MTENKNNILEFPLRLSQICLSNLRDNNACISPIAIEAAFHALSYDDRQPRNGLMKTYPFRFYNYFVCMSDLETTFHESLHNNAIKLFHTEFQFCNVLDVEQKRIHINLILKRYTEQCLASLLLSQKLLEQIIVDPVTLLTCCSLTFRPFKVEQWERLWSLKFHLNVHLSIETEFYFTKGFFHAAFHDTFYKIEIPGQLIDGIPMKLIILLPQCSSDLVHLYANLKEYMNLPVSLSYISVCLPNMSMNIHSNLNESLKLLNDLNQTLHLSAVHLLGHFVLDMKIDETKQSSPKCLHSIDLSPTVPWVFFANRPFLFMVTYNNAYLFIGQMLNPQVRQETNTLFPKDNTLDSSSTKTN